MKKEFVLVIDSSSESLSSGFPPKIFGNRKIAAIISSTTRIAMTMTIIIGFLLFGVVGVGAAVAGVAGVGSAVGESDGFGSVVGAGSGVGVGSGGVGIGDGAGVCVGVALSPKVLLSMA